MIAVEEEIAKVTVEATPPSGPSPNPAIHSVTPNTMPSKQTPDPKDFIKSAASKISSQPLQNYDPHVWGVLTAISNNARKRYSGINIILTADEHCIGRMAEDAQFQIDSPSVSGNHCKIYRKKDTGGDDKTGLEHRTTILLKDTSTNGTYLNWRKLKKGNNSAEVRHGDIISFAAPPQHEVSFAFVYREVLTSSTSTDAAVTKRKAEEFVTENKRLKGIGIGAPKGPISLDDFRSLQRSNMELRKQLEKQVVTIDTLHNEKRTAMELHENEMKELRESLSNSYLDQLKEIHCMLEVKKKELVEIKIISSDQKHAIEDLNERLSASVQSCTEVNEIMDSQKTSIAELVAQLDEEREQRRGEREKATADLKAAVQRAQSEAQQELNRLSDASLRREKEQQEVINKLQESERERCLLVETLRSKLEDSRQKLVISDNKFSQLESQLYEEQLVFGSVKKRVQELELERETLKKELESEKAAQEEAWAKVSAVELEINAAMRDLDFERRRLKSARERIVLRETQLRAFYSSTEEISLLFAKQQEQLKSMQKTLVDEENYENASLDIDLNMPTGITGGSPGTYKVIGHTSNRVAKASLSTSAQRAGIIHTETSSDEASVTEKHDCDIRRQECENTQEAEYTSADHGVKGGFGSDIDGVGTAPVTEGDATGTEQVLETESPGIHSERGIDLNKSGMFGGDTLQLDEETHPQESNEQGRMIIQDSSRHSQSGNPLEPLKDIDDTETAVDDTEASHHSQSDSPSENAKNMDDTEAGGTIRTADLLASEVAGSWACSTAPSVHGENESPSRDKNDRGGSTLHESDGLVAESQSTPLVKHVASRWDHERKALSEMIGIVAPYMKEQFGGDHQQRERCSNSISDSDTEKCEDSDNDARIGAKDGSISDSETVGSDRQLDDVMADDVEATQEDSLG